MSWWDYTCAKARFGGRATNTSNVGNGRTIDPNLEASHSRRVTITVLNSFLNQKHNWNITGKKRACFYSYWPAVDNRSALLLGTIMLTMGLTTAWASEVGADWAPRGKARCVLSWDLSSSWLSTTNGIAERKFNKLVGLDDKNYKVVLTKKVVSQADEVPHP